MADDVTLAIPRLGFSTAAKIRFGLLFAIGAALTLCWYAAIGWIALHMGKAVFHLVTG